MKSITKLQDGKKGVVFKIVDDDDTEHVIKFQGENPARAMVGAQILQTVGVDAPRTESVRGQGMTNFQLEVDNFILQAQVNGNNTQQQVAQQLHDCLQKANNPQSNYQFPHVVRMDFASGTSLENALKDGQQFKQIMTDPSFQRQLGQLMAGDTITGNGDRMMAIPKGSLVEGKNHNETGSAPKLTGWFNPGNLVIDSQDGEIKVKAIDNTVSPGMNVSAQTVFGNWTNYFQYGSSAAANTAQLKREVFAIAELMEKQAGIKLTPEELKDFIENTTNSAKETIDFALSSDSGITPESVGNMLEESGGTNEEATSLSESFGKHQQMLKMMSGAMKTDSRVQPSVREMMKIADKGLTEGEALKELNSLEAKKAMEGMTEDQQDRFKKLMAGERGDHVPKDFKVTVQEASLMAKDESVYKQFTHKGPPRTSVKI